MKKRIILQVMGLSWVALGGFSGCSSMGQSPSAKDIAPTGPTVMNLHADPTTIELNRDLRPTQPATVVADVKDFRSKIKEVHLRFQDVPLVIPMEHVSGTSWRARFTPQQLQMLAVAGKTISYEATVVAQDESGQMTQSPLTVAVNIKAPEISKSTG